MTHRTIDPETARRMLASAATNGDRLTDVETLTALTAIETGQPAHTLTAVLELDKVGASVDERGDIR
jgi:hypothetical protein